MELLNKEYKLNKEIYTLANIPMCTITKDYNFKQKNILNILTKEKRFKCYAESQKFKIFNIAIVERIEDLDEIEIKICGLRIKSINKLDAVKKQLARAIPQNYNKIFILKSNLGEAYLFLKYMLNKLINKNDTTLIVATKPSHLQLVKMLAPKISCTLIPNIKYEINNKSFKINNQTYYIAFPLKFYIDTETKFRNKNNNSYLSEMLNYFKISQENKHDINKIKISDKTKQQVQFYAKKRNLGKFIFISTDANTCKNVSKKFWSKLEKKLNTKVIKNIPNKDLDFVYYLASKADAKITLRSGLSEILSESGNPHIILYTGFKKRYRFPQMSKSQVLNNYSIKDIDLNRNNIHELEYSSLYENEIIEKIVKMIKMREKVR